MSAASANSEAVNQVSREVNQSELLAQVSMHRTPATTSQNALLSLQLMHDMAEGADEKKTIKSYIAEQMKYQLAAMDLVEKNPTFRILAGGLNMDAVSKLATVLQQRATNKETDVLLEAADGKAWTAADITRTQRIRAFIP